MKDKLSFVFLIVLSSVVSYAQDCHLKLETARDYKKKDDYEMAIKYYQMVLKDCGDYDGRVTDELQECKSKVSPKKAPSTYVSSQQNSTGSISNVAMYFDADGNCENNTNVVMVNLNDWDYIVNEESQSWLNAERYGNSLVVTCNRNLIKEERVGKIVVFGEVNDEIVVNQFARRVSSKNAAQNNSISQKEEEQIIIVKINFDAGKANPRFENNVWNIYKAMEENNNLNLLIEVAYCDKLFGMMLVKNRIKKITEYFVSSGIDKSRITAKINVVDDRENSAECDCAYAKIIIKD